MARCSGDDTSRLAPHSADDEPLASEAIRKRAGEQLPDAPRRRINRRERLKRSQQRYNPFCVLLLASHRRLPQIVPGGAVVGV